MNGQPTPLHGFSDGLAVAPGGKRLVAATPGNPVNQLDVIDAGGRTGWRITHPNPRVGLIEPAISPDGQRLAFVVGLPSAAGAFTGVSAIWVSDLHGRAPRIIATPGRLYRHPVFSPDGKRLAYFRDVFEEAAGKALPPENQSGKGMALFEADLATGRETRLLEQAYSSGSRLAYDPGGQDLLYTAGPRLKPVQDGGRIVWLPSDDAFKAVPPAPAHIPLQLLRFDRRTGHAQDIGPALKAIPSRYPGGFMGLTAQGQVALFDSHDQPDHLDWAVYLVDTSGARAVANGREPIYLGQAALSPDGKAFGALYAGVIGQPASNPPGVRGLILGRIGRPDALLRLRLDQVSFQTDDAGLDASLPPIRRP